ncbi:hypothetical protein SAMN02910339_01150 [Lachnospiraceae bacterium YSD2013]|nr:hypothetical protein SAMN02910339_01150 [Lachnospiraceae bacterium YSD2013]
MSDIFTSVPVIKYEGPKSTNPFSFKYYDPERVVLGKKMKEQLPFAMAWWHNLGVNGVDMFGLLKAAEIIEDGRIEGFTKEKYSSFDSELGRKIRDGRATLTELSNKACELKGMNTPVSGKQEYLEAVLNNIMLSGV